MNSSQGLALVALTALAGCAAAPPRQPIESGRPPLTIADEPPAPLDVRATIVGGEAPPPAPPGAVQFAPATGDITLNFPSADVRVVARTVLGDLLRVPYSVAPGVTTPVSLVTPGGVARSAVLGLFETSLRGAGLALTPVGAGFTIQPIAAAQGPVAPGAIGFGTEIIRLQFINAAEVKTIIDSVLPGVVTAADTQQNSVTIAGTTGQRGSARDLIAQFDVNWLRNMSFALFVPQRTDSRLIVPELEKLINAPDAPTRGLVRLIALERLNGILAISAQRQYIDDVRRWVEVLDREGESNEARVFVYRVQNGRARDLARTLNNAFTGASGDTGTRSEAFDDQSQAEARDAPIGAPPAPPADSARGRGEAGADAAQPAGGAGPAPRTATGPEARITADEVNNAVVVFGTPRDFAVVERALRQLDVLPQQVFIEAAITEVSLTDNLRFGVQWNFVTGDNNFSLSEGSVPAPQRDLPGFSYFYGGTDIQVALNALEERTDIKVVSAPKLLVLNNQTAALQVGDQVPILTQTSSGIEDADSRIVNSVQYRDTGVIFRVTPRVNASGLVLLDISQEVSDVAANQVSNIDSPTISTRRVATTVAVQDGQIIALGGLFRNAQSFGKTGIPLLSRIPILGSLLFGRTRDTVRRTELLILLKPRVIRTIDDGRAVTEDLRARLRTLEPFRTQGKIP